MKYGELVFGGLCVLFALAVFFVLMVGALPVLGLTTIITGTAQDGTAQTIIQYHGMLWRNAAICAALSAIVGPLLAQQVRDGIAALITARKSRRDAKRSAIREAQRFVEMR